MQKSKRAAPDRTARTVTAVAVVAVAIMGVTTAFMVERAQRESGSAGPPMVLPNQPVPGDKALVQAPRLDSPSADLRSQAMGSSAACRKCGTVELVVALVDRGQQTPRAYQMHIRMDDGELRAIEQRGAMAAGSRVIVENGSVRALPGPG